MSRCIDCKHISLSVSATPVVSALCGKPNRFLCTSNAFLGNCDLIVALRTGWHPGDPPPWCPGYEADQ